VGAFPLHSDGAHLSQPPDYIVLAANSASPTPTLLWSEEINWLALQDDLRHGLFRVAGGDRSFLAVAHDGTRLRFDPGCMLPIDRRSKRVLEYFASAVSDASRHYWSGERQVVVIDNRRTLHARGDATGEPTRSLGRIMLRKPASP
jgi:alpha-ketoglutarate-dependent taurine dioxygenase